MSSLSWCDINRSDGETSQHFTFDAMIAMGRPKEANSNVTPRAKVWFKIDGQYVFGLGISSILEAVDESGSINSAAAALGKSYRHVWSRIKEVEQSLGMPLVETQVGGSGTRRSELTQVAHKLIVQFREMRSKVFVVVEEEFARHAE